MTRAWLEIGIGGLTLLLMAAFPLSHVAWSSLGMAIAGIAAWFVVRGARVVAQAGPHLLAAPVPQALPAARVMTSRPRNHDDRDR